MALTNAQQDAAITALKSADVALDARLKKLEGGAPPPPPPPPPVDTTADVGGDLKVTIAPPAPGKTVSYTVAGLDVDALAVVTFKDSAGVLMTQPVATNGTRTVALLSTFAYGVMTATIKATDAVGNVATGAPASVTLTAPTAPPPPPPPPPTGTGVAQINLGPFDMKADTVALGGAFATYESRFATWAERHWLSYGPRWEGNGGAGYDLAKCYYVWHERTGNSIYLARAHALALDYRDRHVCSGVKSSFNPLGWQGSPEWWGQYLGFLLHYKHTNDAKTLSCIGHNGDLHAYEVVDRRTTAKITGSWNAGRPMYQDFNALYAALLTNAPSIGAPSDTSATGKAAGGHNWQAALDQLISDFITTQNTAGYWRFEGPTGQIWFYPYQMGLMMNCLVTYWMHVKQDPRIPGAIKKCCDWLWNVARDPVKGTFRYVQESNVPEGEMYSATGAGAELTAMVLNGFGFVYYFTGDATYKTRGDDMMTNIMLSDGSNTPPGAYLDGYKQFQEVYSFSYMYPKFRSIAPLNKAIGT